MLSPCMCAFDAWSVYMCVFDVRFVYVCILCLLCLLCYVSYVIFVMLGPCMCAFDVKNDRGVMGTPNEFWHFDLASFELPRSRDGKKLFVCLDGFNNSESHEAVLQKIEATIAMTQNQFVVCSSMSTLGKRDVMDDRHTATRLFFMHSWSRSEYHEALDYPAFF